MTLQVPAKKAILFYKNIHLQQHPTGKTIMARR